MSCSCGCGGKCKSRMISTRIGKATLSVPSSICKGRKRRGAVGCCFKSHLRGEGIKRVPETRNIYFADANLICTGALCSGRDRDIVYEWTLTPTDKANPGNLRIVGNSRRVGNDRVEIAGTGTFDLHVRVVFKCTRVSFRVFIDNCVSTRTVRFTQ